MAPLSFHLLLQAHEVSLQTLNACISISTFGHSNLDIKNIASQPIYCSCLKMPHLCGAQLFHVTRVVPCLQRNLKFPRSLPGISISNWVLHLPFFGEACHTCLQLFEASQPNSQDQTPQRRSQHRLGEACRFLRHAHGRMQHQNML